MSLVQSSHEITNQPIPAPPIEPQPPQPSENEEYISTDPAHPYFNSLKTTAFHSASTQYEFSSSFIGCNDYINQLSRMAYYADCENYNKIVSTEAPYMSKDKDKLTNRGFRYGWTALMYTCWGGNRKFFDNLFANYNIIINKQCQEGFTALHLACIRKNIELIIPLIKHGADITILDDYDYCPLDYLTQYPINVNEIKNEFIKEQNWKRRKFFMSVYNNIMKCDYRHPIFEKEELIRTITSFV